MKRNSYVNGVSLASLGAVVPGRAQVAGTVTGTGPGRLAGLADSCSPAWPGSIQFRRDIRDAGNGPALALQLQVTDTISGRPVPNAWVKVWHCEGDLNQRCLCGTQLTDAHGNVNFTTLVPAAGQPAHLYFRVYTTTALVAASQLTFNGHGGVMYSAHPVTATNRTGLLSSPGNILVNGYALQAVTPAAGANGGLTLTLPLVINTNNLLNPNGPDPLSHSFCSLLQNFPEPYDHETTIPISIDIPSDVELELYTRDGVKIASVKMDDVCGDHTITLHTDDLCIPADTYVYQLIVSNRYGTWRDCRVMTHEA